MKRSGFHMLLLLFFYCNGHAQTAASIQDGNWTSPATWSCTCVPVPGYTIEISHRVTLNTSFGYNSGAITINSGASLIEDGQAQGRDILVNGGDLTNNGTLDLHYLWTQSGTFSNGGILTATSILNNINFTNTGTFHLIDSIYNTATVINAGNFFLIDSITNTGPFTNNGACTFNQFTNNGVFVNNSNLAVSDITNNGFLTNNADTVNISNSGWNLGEWINMANSYVFVFNSFFNDDISMHDAMLNNNGTMVVMNSWHNMDTVRGASSGNFFIGDTSYNAGWMKQNFDFCDQTSPASAPFVDINTGTISPGITWCNNSAVPEQETPQLTIFPNPAGSDLFFISEDKSDYTIIIYDVYGKLTGLWRNISSLHV